MVFRPSRIGGVYLIEPERKSDERGYFARTFCQREFGDRGLVSRFVQCNTSFNARRATLRGMHFQKDPHPEMKVVRCTRGAAYDVVVDLRRNSTTFCAWEGFEITAESGASVYIPAGVAHGFVTLADDTELLYQMSEYYYPALACGVRWNDPAFAIAWPVEPAVIAARDAAYPDFRPAEVPL